MDPEDKKLKYYIATKELIHMLIRPFPLIYSLILSTYILIIFFAKKDFTTDNAITNGLQVINLWIGSIAAINVYDDCEKRGTFTINKNNSYFWGIVTPILWLVFTNFLWFMSLPIYVMYRKRMR